MNILVRYRCKWSRSSSLVSRSQLLMFLTVPGKCAYPLSSSLCCEVEFWTSWSHDSTWNLKTPKSAITRFAPPTAVVSWVGWRDLSGHNIPFITIKVLYFASMMPRVYSLKTVSTSDGRCMGVCFSISEEKKM